MASNIGETVVYLLAGMRCKIKAPVNIALGQGWFPATEPQYVGGSTEPVTPTKGFIVQDEKIGTITPNTTDGDLSVIYTHKMALENKVWFYAATGEIAVCTISSVTIHDHSSIVQGGPAFGTYFSDDEADQNAT